MNILELLQIAISLFLFVVWLGIVLGVFRVYRPRVRLEPFAWVGGMPERWLVTEWHLLSMTCFYYSDGDHETVGHYRVLPFWVGA